MSYILKHIDKNLVEFDFHFDPIDGYSIEIIKLYKENKTFLPINLNIEGDMLLEWIKRRSIPKNRKFVHKTLQALNLSIDNIQGIIDISKGLSLNDCYWIVKDDFEGTFDHYNLYDNDFNKVLSLIAYTGYGSLKPREFVSSPEFTTNGMLAKSWRRIQNSNTKNKEIVLYKAGSADCANCGKEPYSEYYAYQIAKQMGIVAVEYRLGKWKGTLSSICPLFTSKDISFVPIYRIVREGSWRAVLSYYRKLGESYYEALIDMLVFDAIICNSDRHFGNFGLLVDNHSNQIIDAAPIFDNGLSLFHDAMPQDFQHLDAFAQEKWMKNAGGFIEFIQEVIGKSQKAKVRQLINFHFTQHPTHKKLSKRNLVQIEAFIQRRIHTILNLKENPQ